MTLQQHIRLATHALLLRFEQQVRQTMLFPDEEAIHHLRVSVRRLRECLRTFAPLFPDRPRKRIRKQLQNIMKRAGNIRSADIALGLLRKAGTPELNPLYQEIQHQRGLERTALLQDLAALGTDANARKWREKLLP